MCFKKTGRHNFSKIIQKTRPQISCRWDCELQLLTYLLTRIRLQLSGSKVIRRQFWSTNQYDSDNFMQFIVWQECKSVLTSTFAVRCNWVQRWLPGPASKRGDTKRKALGRKEKIQSVSGARGHSIDWLIVTSNKKSTKRETINILDHSVYWRDLLCH